MPRAEYSGGVRRGVAEAAVYYVDDQDANSDSIAVEGLCSNRTVVASSNESCRSLSATTAIASGHIGERSSSPVFLAISS